jgi:hypothetical protein
MGDRVTNRRREAPLMRARRQSINRSSNRLHHGASRRRGRRRRAPTVTTPNSRRGRCRCREAPPPPHHHGRPGRRSNRGLHSEPSSLAATAGQGRRRRATALAGEQVLSPLLESPADASRLHRLQPPEHQAQKNTTGRIKIPAKDPDLLWANRPKRGSETAKTLPTTLDYSGASPPPPPAGMAAGGARAWPGRGEALLVTVVRRETVRERMPPVPTDIFMSTCFGDAINRLREETV